MRSDPYISGLACVGHPPEHRDWSPEHAGRRPHIGPGARVEAFATVDAGIERPTTIGAGSWLMKHCHVGHDAIVGPDCELAPGTVVCGHAELGKGVRCGVNASILPFRNVGDGARIGAGAVVTKDVPAGEVWAGNPARQIFGRNVAAESRNTTVRQYH
jgi:acetyltransferase-like isoleucine patch superfamily enzyme